MTKNLAFEAWLTCIENEKAGVLATVLQTGKSKSKGNNVSLFYSKENHLIGSLGDPLLDREIGRIAKEKLNEKSPKSETRLFYLENGEEIQVFIDVYKPPPEIIIFGAGHDAIPVARFSVLLGFRTTVVDQRDLYNTEERFPGANRIIVRTNEYKEKVLIKDNSYIIIMNHHLKRDQDALKFVLNSSAPYIGVLGPLSRRNRILDGLRSEGMIITECQLEHLYNPIGLDIGAQSPEEIAISIIAEILAIKNGYPGGFLKDSEFIHQVSNA